MLNRPFSKEDIEMANKHTKRASTLLIIRETQIKTTTRYPLMSIRTAITKKIKEISVGEDVEKREPSYNVIAIVNLVQLLWKTVWRFRKKLKVELSHNPAIPLLVIYPKTKC